MNLDQAREWLSASLTELDVAQRSGDPIRIGRAQYGVEKAESVLREVTLREEGGWKP